MAQEPDQVTREEDRRRYFRIEDEVGLLTIPIRPEDEAQIMASFDDGKASMSLINELRAARNTYLPQRRSLEHKFPTVAAYVRMLESQIDMLALAIENDDGFVAAPNTLINLSAQGLSFDDDEPLEIGVLVELRLTLFPDLTRIRTLARVVRCEADPPCKSTALEFIHLRDADREAIIRHVHVVQRMRLRAHTEAEFDSDLS